jgi:hypothetical protein
LPLVNSERQLVGQAELDVDALDAFGVLAHPRQRDDDVLVDLERVGVLADRRGALAVEPELLARLGADRHEAFAGARVGDADDFARRARHRVGVVADDVAEQHHLRQAAALALGRVADRLEVAVVEVLEAGEQDALARRRLLRQIEQVVADLDDRRHRVLGVAEELEADRSHVRRHLVDDPARRRDQPVAAFLLDSRNAGEELVGDVLAEPFLPEHGAGHRQPLGALELLAAGVEIPELERHLGRVVDLAEVVVQARDLEPLRVRRHHPPRGEVVERGAPEHRLLAARVHRDVAAHARRFRGRRVDREHVAGTLGRLCDALRDDAGLGPHGRDVAVDAGQRDALDLAHRLELLGVDDGARPGERHGAAGVAGAAAAGDDGQAELDAAGDQARHLGLGVGREDDERVLDAPVGRVRDVRDAREAVELDVVLGGDAREDTDRALPQVPDGAELRRERLDRVARELEQLADDRVAAGVGRRRAALLDLAQAVVQCVDQLRASARVVEQVVLQIGVSLHDPDVAEHLVQHACRAAGATLAAQEAEHVPRARPEQADDDLAIRERRVVVRNLAQARRGAGCFCFGADPVDRQRGVHGGRRSSRPL